MLAKYILSKLDFQSFSLVDPVDPSDQQRHSEMLNRVQIELRAYIDALKQIPTVMRKLAPSAKSESYRLFKSENFHSFEQERHQTDLFLAASIIH